ncbi:hypothetical protein AGLY_018126 [Aphis glycines]|uniref:Uncharacterized protein n=1 Tax=Aphis glycines TaxID=307491 RepID=A0A6G0SSX5_APHGL|nr:hypothetical protein AGLY_018126 [Aphis glycines]
MSCYYETVGNMFHKAFKDFRFAVENHPQSLISDLICFKIKILFKYRFGRIPVLCKICRFRSFFFLFMSIIMKTVGNCSLLTVISIKDIRFAVENHPQMGYVFKLKILFKYRFGRIPVLCEICRFRSFFFLFMSIIMKTVGNCSLLTVISIKDIRFAVENHPQCLFAVFGHFFFVYLNYFENCLEMFTFNGYKHQGHSICSRKPPSKVVIGAFFRLICRFRSFFFLFISIILKTVGKCSLLTVISIKDIRFAVENNPHSLYVFKLKILFKYRFGRIPVLCKICRFRSFFSCFMSTYYENCWELFTFNGYKHQGHSICSRKPPSKFVIGAFFRLVMLYKETKKKNFRNL